MSTSVDQQTDRAASHPYTPESGQPAEMIRGRRRVDWRSILLEAFFVVLGIVLALGANEWRQTQIDERNARQALASIREEMEANRAAVVRSAEYHIQITDSISALTRRAGPGAVPLPDRSLFSRGFINPAPVVTTAWEAAGAVDAVRHMPYADVLIIARMYEQQDRYSTQSELAGGVIYNALFDRGFEGILRNQANLGSIIGGFWYRECQLLVAYDEALAKLGGTAGGRMPERCQLVLGR
jgi:hypothetical protein